MENAVLLALRRRGMVPAYASEIHQWECDFAMIRLALRLGVACLRQTGCR